MVAAAGALRGAWVAVSGDPQEGDGVVSERPARVGGQAASQAGRHAATGPSDVHRGRSDVTARAAELLSCEESRSRQHSTPL